MKITSVKRYSVQILRGTNGELTFEKNNRFKKKQNKNRTQFNIKKNKDGKIFIAKNLSELFLSRITTREIVDTVEDLVILFSDLH